MPTPQQLLTTLKECKNKFTAISKKYPGTGADTMALYYNVDLPDIMNAARHLEKEGKISIIESHEMRGRNPSQLIILRIR